MKNKNLVHGNNEDYLYEFDDKLSNLLKNTYNNVLNQPVSKFKDERHSRTETETNFVH